jgi:hypothetical protein
MKVVCANVAGGFGIASQDESVTMVCLEPSVNVSRIFAIAAGTVADVALLNLARIANTVETGLSAKLAHTRLA